MHDQTSWIEHPKTHSYGSLIIQDLSRDTNGSSYDKKKIVSQSPVSLPTIQIKSLSIIPVK